jgi:KUP system potassium uptake protein
VIVYSAIFVKYPHVPSDRHLKIHSLRKDLIRVPAYYGFIESPDVPWDLAEANRLENLGLNLDTITYFVGGKILLAKPEMGMGRVRGSLYALMARNEIPATRYFNLPPAQVFEIGTQIPI